MKRIVTLILTALLILSTTGCKEISRAREEIDRIIFIEAVGIDKSPSDKDKVLLTLSSSSKKVGGGGGGAGASGGDNQQKSSKVIMKSDGRTLFEATRKVHAFSYAKPTFGHVQYILVGEDAAKEDIAKYLDFFERDHEVRFNSKVIIVKGGTARQVMMKANTIEKSLSDTLTDLFDGSISLSISGEVPLPELMGKLDNKYLAANIPCIEMVNRIFHGGEPKKESEDIELSGYAIFKNGKLLNYLTYNEGRGLNWLTNKIVSGVMVVNDKEGDYVSLELIKNNTKIMPKLKDGELFVTVEIVTYSNIPEYQGKSDIFNESTFKFLEKQQEKIIKNEVQKVIQFAKKNNVDIFDVSDILFHKDPVKWEKTKKEWFELFPKATFNVVVHSTISMTYDIREPTGSKAGGSK